MSGSPRDNFLKNGCKWCLMSPFCQLLVNIFSNFATTPRIYVMREYFHLLIYIEREFSPLAKEGGCLPRLFFFLVGKTDANDAF